MADLALRQKATDVSRPFPGQTKTKVPQGMHLQTFLHLLALRVGSRTCVNTKSYSTVHKRQLSLDLVLSLISRVIIDLCLLGRKHCISILEKSTSENKKLMNI